jgi:hypothetical protein
MQFDEYKYTYYYTLRMKSREKVVNSLNLKIKDLGARSNWEKITLCSINRKATEYARLEWPKYYTSSGFMGFEYSWERLYFKFLNNPAHFDLAVWQDIDGIDVLQGLALGKPSGAKRNLNINWIERSCAPSYFKGGVLLPILACAEEYAKLLGSERVVIKCPIDSGTFERYGYVPFGKPKDKQLAKEISHV